MVAVQTLTAVAASRLPQSTSRRWAFLRLGIVCSVIVCAGLLGGCASPGSPVVTDRSLGDRSQQTYVVVRGDTLYSIAWRFNLDHRRLAKANGIGAPFTIYPGQKLRLSELPIPVSRQSPQTARASADQGLGQTGRRPVLKTASAAKSASASEPMTKPETKPETKPATKSTAGNQRSSQPRTKAPAPKPAARTAQGGQTWYRPLPQRPSVPFGSNNKGLDYAITARSKVRSTRSGEVVYAGNGIAGFERLVIVKHTTDLLSAYSFNGKILVAEQQRVAGGAIIADILPRPGVGQKLHFEVRRKGQPINPATLLPKS